MSEQRNEKRGEIYGGLESREALDSASNFATPSHYGAHKGAQQFFTPEPAAKMVGRFLHAPQTTVLDLQAGDGSLIRAWPQERRFGVELDPDQAKNADEAGRSYQRIIGDVQQVFPLLLKTLPPLTTMAVNPPFGLRWSHPTFRQGREVNSALLTLYFVEKLLAPHGQYVFICGRDRFYREIAEQPEAQHIYAAINVSNLFEGTDLPAVICAGAKGLRSKADLATTDLTVEQLEEHGTGWLDAQWRERGVITSRFDYNNAALAEAWPAIAREHKRRFAEKHSLREFDLTLIGGSILDAQPSAFAELTLARLGKVQHVKMLHRQSVHYFVQNEAAWKTVQALADDEVIRVDPRVTEIVEAGLHEARRILAPLYPLKPQQRLGFLTEENTIECVKDDPENGFVAGEKYGVLTDSVPVETQHTELVQVKTGKRAGDWEERKYRRVRKMLRIRLTEEPGGSGAVMRTLVDDETSGKADILYIIDHFKMPEPLDVATRYPEDYERMLAALRKIESEKIIPNTREAGDERRFRNFQIEDLARLLIKESGLLAWEQGLGKTLGGDAFAEACVALGAQDAVLIVAPQDLIPQWIRELELYFGRKVELLKTHAQAHEVARRLKRGGSGWYITYYEALSTSGTRQTELMPEFIVDTKVTESLVEGHYEYDSDDYKPTWVPEQIVTETKELWSTEFCPVCHADSGSDWDGVVCNNVVEPTLENKLAKPRRCGYVHYRKRVKPMGSLLSTAFRKGVIVVDEQTMMKGDEAMRAKVVRGLMARHKLGMTGTPVKNFIPDAFWLLWWCLSHNEKRFPYRYLGGKTKFENDFAVVQYEIRDSRRSGNRKVLPDVTNLSMLWKLLCSSIIRRRKEETGEPIVDRRFHTVEVPLGVTQQAFTNKWLKAFPAFFTEKNPDHKLVRAGLVDIWAPMIGLQAKLDYAATLPEADPDWPWTQHTVSNWTPANLRALELTLALVQQGRKVLIGSNQKRFQRWVCERLVEKGVHATHLLNSRDDTADPKIRARLVYEFQTDKTQVLCAGIKALRLGHNVDAASAVIVHGPEWDYESFSQFIARAHRLTSKKSVDVYVIVPSGSLTAKKWDRLQQKGDAADLALDGRITEYQEEEVDQAEVIRELMERGVPITGNEVDELEVERAWSALGNVYTFAPPDGLLGDTGEHVFLPMHPAVVAPAVVTVPADRETPATVEVEIPGGRHLEIVLPEIPDDFFEADGQASLFDDEMASFLESGD